MKELSGTFQAFKDIFANFQLPQSSSSVAQQLIPPNPEVLPSGSRGNPEDIREDAEEEHDSDTSNSPKESDGERKQGGPLKTLAINFLSKRWKSY